jgi:hypothetical protein
MSRQRTCDRVASLATSLVTLALLSTASPGLARAEEKTSGAPDVSGTFDPTRPRGLTRLRANVRPFVSMVGRSGGAIMDFTGEYYFAELPLKLSLELAPLALAIEGDGTGAIGHLRLGAAFSTDHVEIGASAGSRLQNYGASGISLAGFLRLGRLDGLKLTMTYGYVLARNRYTGIPIVGLSNAMATVDVPLSARTALYFEAGGSGDLWVYGSGGLRYRIGGDAGPSTWVVSGSLGLGWVLDRPDCRHPGTGWCTDSAWALGPTMGFGLERRF